MRPTHVSTWTALAIATSIAAAAGQAAEPRTAQATPDLGRTVTLRGCLQSWDGSPTGIGAGDASAPGAQYVLTHAEESPTPPAPTGTGGTGAPSATAPMAHNTYVVQPKNQEVELRSFLDQQVEVTGTLEVIPPHDASARGTKPESAAPGQTAAAPPPSAPAPSVPGTRPQTTAPRTPMQRLLVAAMKTVAKTCP
jgi:hypothetical protein